MAEDPKGEYEESLTVGASADTVIDFVADVSNLPKYMPTTKAAQSQGEDRVRVQGDAQGHHYDSDGYLRRATEQGRLEWGADEGYYSGWLQVRPEGEGANVTVHISLRGAPPGADPDSAPAPEQIQEGLRKSLESIRNHVEGRGGKEEPSAAT